MRKLNRQFFSQSVGTDGLTTFMLSNLVLIATLGLIMLVILLRVIREAVVAPDVAAEGARSAIVAGYLLTRQDEIQPVFRKRLDRSHVFLSQGQFRTVHILGGKTGSGNRSEGAAGRHYLLDKGNDPAVVLIEEESKHTLENVINFRDTLSIEQRADSIYIITSRYHLYRSLIMAKGLGLNVYPLAAEEAFPFTLRSFVASLKEAYLLHWYYVGTYWSRLTGNQKSLDRIS